MKKLLALLLCATMMLSLAACSSSEPQVEGDTQAETDVEIQDTETPNMNDLDGEQAVAPLPDDDFTENEVSPEASGDTTVDEDTTTPEVAPETPVTPESTTPAVTPTTPEVAPETPSVTPEEIAPEAPAATTLSAQSIYDAIIAANADFPANMLVEGEFLDMTYAGLADASSDFVVYMPMMSAVAAEIAIAKTTDAAAVSAIFQGRIDYQVEGGAFYPETTEGWNSNSHIITVGDYVMLLACPASETEFAQQVIDLFTTTVGA